MEKLERESLDLVRENIKKLKEIFPDVFTEGKIDFEKLKENLGEFVEESEEKYQFTWFGKRKANQLALTPTRATLRPAKGESKNWETTKNLYIEGDNLEVLKVLQKAYYKKVKMIYIDPPYNTGKDFIYRDNYQDNLENYLKMTRQIDEEGNPLTTNTDKSGRKHSNWLNMMYPRLKLARNLLRDDGVIFVSIDDNEVHNLRKIMDEIFGEENFVASFMWKRKKEISNDSKNVSFQGEYILTYIKSERSSLNLEKLSQEYIEKAYFQPNEKFPLGRWRPVPITVSKGLKGGGYEYEIVTPGGRTIKRIWAYPKKSYLRLLKENRIYFGKDDNGIPQRIIYDFESQGKPVTNYWDNVATNKEGKKEILKLFGENFFDTPKPVNLIKKILKISTSTSQSDLILDFFSGSATTAHAVMELNAEDGGNRRFIMVQLPEPTDPKSEAYKAGYKNICEIGKERIRRAGEMIKEKYKEKEGIESLDIGFKVFKLDSTNFKEWDPNPENLRQNLLNYGSFIKDGRSEEDLLYEILLKYGIELTSPIEERKIGGKRVYIVDSGKLIIFFDEIDIEIAKEMVELVQSLPSDFKVLVIRDDSFKNSQEKVNIIEFFKQMKLFNKILTL
jgi:adenine-specific DNA-methyltransferase